MRVLIAGIVKQTPKVYERHLQSLKAQVVPEPITFDYAAIDDNDNEESSRLLHEHALYVLDAIPKPKEAQYAVEEGTHSWNIPSFHWLAGEKQRLMDLASKEHYDAILLVDSDLVLGTDTLRSLLSTNKDVVSGVFWTQWDLSMPALPQVWLGHPYELQGRGMEAHEFLRRLASRDVVPVLGGGACILIRRKVFKAARYWPLVDNLPTHGMWQGEDRHFAVRLQRQHVEMWADAWPDIYHLYRPSLFDEPVVFPEEKERPQIGDLVSVLIDPLEEPQLAEYSHPIRGRLGTLPLIPELEYAISDMKVGEKRIVSVRFPHFYEHVPYQGQERKFQVTLVSAKEFSLPPHLGSFNTPMEVSLATTEAFFES